MGKSKTLSRIMRLGAGVGVLAVSASVALSAGAAGSTPTTTLFLASNAAPNITPAQCRAQGGCGPTVTAPMVLASGQSYLVRVTGTVSVWEFWAKNACGHPRPRPEYLTPGKITPTSDDAVFRFANHVDNRDCTFLPRREGLFQVNLGDGWFTPIAQGNPSKPSGNGGLHPYVFQVFGQGKEPRFRFVDFHPRDNDGAFKLVIGAGS